MCSCTYEYVIFMYVCAPRVCLVLTEVRRSEEGNGCPETRGMDNCSYLPLCKCPQTHLKSCFWVLLLLLNLYWRNSWCPPQLSSLCYSPSLHTRSLCCPHLALQSAGWAASPSPPPMIILLWGNYHFCWGKGSLFRMDWEREKQEGNWDWCRERDLFIPKTCWVPVTLLEGSCRCQAHHRSSQVKGGLVVPEADPPNELRLREVKLQGFFSVDEACAQTHTSLPELSLLSPATFSLTVGFLSHTGCGLLPSGCSFLSAFPPDTLLLDQVLTSYLSR